VGLGNGRIIASGGVSSLADVLAVQAAGCAGVIIGRAIYEGRVDLAEVLRALGTNPPHP
jgi:phosphoribosylformimino-5-aminoimidazole carboxamide ribotide isomerase